MSDFELVIRGKLVDADGTTEDGWLGCLDGKIAARGIVGAAGVPRGQDNIDARGMWVMPGVIDGQVHTNVAAGCEGIGQASRAAAAGGITLMVSSPSCEEQPVSSRRVLDERIAEIKRDAYVDVAITGALCDKYGLEAALGLVDGGVCAFKFSRYGAVEGEGGWVDEDDLHEAFRLLASSGLACEVHNQMHRLTEKLVSELAEERDTGWDAHMRAHTPLVENLATSLIFEIGAETGARAHAVHVSTPRGFEICNMYKRSGVRASVGTCVQHLMLSHEEHSRRLRGRAVEYPPIRPRAEADRLWSHIANGDCDFISSNHVAWATERKDNPDIFRNAMGGPGLETLLPAFWTGCELRGIAPSMVVRMLCEGPARHFLVDDRKGSLQAGMDADIVLLEREHHIYDARSSLSAAQWSAFEGVEFNVRVAATYCRGALVHERGSVDPFHEGYGRFVKPRRGALHSQQRSPQGVPAPELWFFE